MLDYPENLSIAVLSERSASVIKRAQKGALNILI